MKRDTTGLPAVRRLDPSDLDWVADLAARRRAGLAEHAPRLWSPAPDATARHRAFVADALRGPGSLALRTDHGYVLAVPGARGGRAYRVVDDWAVEDPAAWPDEGSALLRTVLDAGAVRVVVPVAERERRVAAEALGLVPVESWWHRDLPPTRVTQQGGAVGLGTTGATGRLVPAPALHDPGGPVLLVTEASDVAALAALETDAARRGATVSVVVTRPDDSGVLDRELLLAESGHVLTTLFLEPR